MEEVSHTRAERKEQTRQAIMDATLALTAESSLVAVSLRQVAKEVGIVPTAFYRHFDSVESLGVSLVDQSFTLLRTLLREVWQQTAEVSELLDESMPIVAAHIRTHRSHYTFLARERAAGPPRVREAIRHEFALNIRKVATDLARLPGAEQFSGEDLDLLADLIVSFVVVTAERLVEDPDQEDRIVAARRTQLRMLLLGVRNWHPGG